MAETITPVVYGGRTRWVVALSLHVLGATLTAALFGAALGALGALLGGPFGRAGLVALAAAGLVYALGTLPRLSVPVPQLRRQVPDWWRTFFSPRVAAFLYGAGLGVGFLTFLATGGLVVVTAAAVLAADPWLGVLVVAPFGSARGLSAVVSAQVRTDDDGTRLVERLAGRSDRPRLATNGVALVGVAVVALASFPTGASGGWGGLASAALAVVFGWAAASKWTGGRRWTRTLAAHALPARVERAARWSVPAAEGLVPSLVLLGLPRTSAAWSSMLLLVFSVEIVRVRVTVGRSVPCGCFGGRGTIDPAAALVRNAGFLVLAVVALAGTRDDPAVAWPGSPGPGDLVPMALATVGLLVAVLTLWRATSWLRRQA
jgi:hypothetical protein